jgi:uncharacterized protein (TIGR00369 family)
MASAMADDAAPGGFAERLGARAVSADDGRATVRFDATDEHLNPAGTLHGGVLATLVDTAMGLLAASQGPAASVRAVGGEGALSLTVCDADVEQDGRVVHAVATFALLHD